MSPEIVIRSLGGGALIGLAAVIVLLCLGKIAGVSGIARGAGTRDKLGRWRLAFVVGLIAAGGIGYLHAPENFAFLPERSSGAIIAAGLLVGVGTRLGSGCTSGHGVCGIGRLSRRSVLATITFVATGTITVWVVRTVFGGAL